MKSEDPALKTSSFLLSWILVIGFAFGSPATLFADNLVGLRVGVARRSITPEILLPISGGIGEPQPTTGKRGEIDVRVIVLRQGETTVAIVSLDVLGFPRVLGDRIRKQVPEIAAENILIAASHTHSAPDCYALPDGKGGHTGDLDYIDFVCKQSVEAIHAARRALKPAWLKVATDEAQGKIAYNYYAPDLYDRRMSVIQAISHDGTPFATLVNYAIHPEVLGPDAGFISPDAIGPMRDQIESQIGGMALFVNGAQGGMITADNRNLDRPKADGRGYWDDTRSWDECLRIGKLMASESLRIIQTAPTQKNPTLFCEAIHVRFPVESKIMWALMKGSPLKYPHNDDQTITASINLLNLGNAQILTVPGEALPNIGFYLKRKMNGKHNLLFGLTNDAFGYILTKVDFNSFPRYEYISQTSLGEMTGEILIEESLNFVRKSPSPDRLE